MMRLSLFVKVNADGRTASLFFGHLATTTAYAASLLIHISIWVIRDARCRINASAWAHAAASFFGFNQIQFVNTSCFFSCCFPCGHLLRILALMVYGIADKRPNTRAIVKAVWHAQPRSNCTVGRALVVF